MPKTVLAANQKVGYLALKTLIDQGKPPALTLAQKRDPSEHIDYPSVENLARANHLPVFVYDSSRKQELLKIIADLQPDYLFSIYWRFIFSQEMLALFKRGAFNFHGSLLPKFRGAHPTNWAILKGEKEIGYTLHYLDAGIDTGDIVFQEKFTVDPDESAQSVREKQDAIAIKMLVQLVEIINAGQPIPRRPQDHSLSTYFGKRSAEDGRIDWTQKARSIHNLIRALTRPYPGAFTFCKNKKLILWKTQVLSESACGKPAGEILAYEPNNLQIATGSGILQATDFSFEDAPNILQPGERLGE